MIKKALIFCTGVGIGVLVGSNIGYEAAVLEQKDRANLLK